jgi:hypothetical protein
VLCAAREPVPLLLVQRLGMQEQLQQLPAWTVLFYVRDYQVRFCCDNVLKWRFITCMVAAATYAQTPFTLTSVLCMWHLSHKILLQHWTPAVD